ncbi:hypothetical protein [Shouchella patagoniensis]|uniref:hypothetical protein n=1 Tax=Shouchella patagoniensis TaxID=228576 RepID=UPI0009952521|nr:hypothetical protein [Shouchella patagoniensis]
MAVVPLKQTAVITKPGGVNEWGNQTPSESYPLKCRYDEGSRIIASRSGGVVTNETAISVAKVLFDKLQDIGYNDDISLINELGITMTRKPKEINIKRNHVGRPILTEVFI